MDHIFSGVSDPGYSSHAAGLKVGQGLPAEPRSTLLAGTSSITSSNLRSKPRERVRERERFNPARCARLGVSRFDKLKAPSLSRGNPGYNEPRSRIGAALAPSHFQTFSPSHLLRCGSTGRAGTPFPAARTTTSPTYWRPTEWPPYPRSLTTLRVCALAALLFFALFLGPVSSLPAQGDRGNIPEWKVDPAFKNDVFTFARVRYESRGWSWRRSGGNWTTDTPDADLNLSFRLQQMTSLKVNPQPAVVDLTQKNLGDYPFIYIVEPGRLVFRDEEVVALRNYLEKGGFLMIDDFWGENEWANIESEIKRVFPNREIVDLPLEHPIFHCVFDLKEKPQVPGIRVAERVRGTGITWERDDAKEVHYRAIFDNKGRMMVIICQNTDNGDGWEEEGSAKWYFDEFSEKKAYPLAINIIFYAMTH